MCRSIKPLRRPERNVTDAEIQAAALQFVRKVSGYRKPARSNAVPFDAAVDEIATATRRLLVGIGALDEGDHRKGAESAEDRGERAFVILSEANNQPQRQWSNLLGDGPSPASVE